MTTYAKELELIASSAQWDIPYLQPLMDSIRSISDALSALELSDAWTGSAADEASIAIAKLTKRFNAVYLGLGDVRTILSDANGAKSAAANAEAHLPNSWIPDWVEAKVMEGSEVVFPPLGTLTAETAIQVIGSYLDKGREDEAKVALDALRDALSKPSYDMAAARSGITEEILKRDPNPGWEGDPGGPTGPGRIPGGGGGGGGGIIYEPPVRPDPWVPRPPIDGPFPPPRPPIDDPWPPTVPRVTDPYIPGIAVDGNSHGASASGSAFGGGGAGIGSGSGIGGTAGSLGVGGRLGSSLGAGGGIGGLDGIGASAANARNGSSMMGGGGGQGGGGGDKDKRANLGLTAPKLEDDEPTTPRSAAAGAGGRE